MRILLGVCGGIAAYKACALVSALVQRGDDVDVVMTEEAQHFVGAVTFAALTRRHVTTSLWDEASAIAHIDLVRSADVFAVMPATANMIAKLALGLADDVISTAALAARIPLVIAPAMNDAMYVHPATQAHLATLRARGVIIVEPEDGFLAERERGIGRLAAQDQLIAALDAAGGPAVERPRPAALDGMRVLITAGPTREAIDPVRFISNGATGATGIALAHEAARRGAAVTLILGPTVLPVAAAVNVKHVVTAQEMAYAAHDAVSLAPHLVIATAAVADHRPAHVSAEKMKKGRDAFDTVPLEPTPDVVAQLRTQLPQAYIVGFAAETQAHEANGRRKLETKRLDAIAVNDVRNGRGFGETRNALQVYFSDGTSIEIPDAKKSELAAGLLDVLVPRVRARSIA